MARIDGFNGRDDPGGQVTCLQGVGDTVPALRVRRSTMVTASRTSSLAAPTPWWESAVKMTCRSDDRLGCWYLFDTGSSKSSTAAR